MASVEKKQEQNFLELLILSFHGLLHSLPEALVVLQDLLVLLSEDIHDSFELVLLLLQEDYLNKALPTSSINEGSL